MKIKLKKQIHGDFATASSKDRWLKKEIESPIAPFIGLQISMGNFKATIKEVVVTNNGIECWDEEDMELYNANLHKWEKVRSIDEIVKEWLEIGWEEDN